MGVKAKKIETLWKFFRMLIPVCNIRRRHGIR